MIDDKALAEYVLAIRLALREVPIEEHDEKWHAAQDALDALRAEVERLRLRDAQLCDAAKLIETRAQRAEAEVARLRVALVAAPGGHSCEEFHHGKADRHLPGEPCPPQERWEAALAALVRAGKGEADE